jgi:hypothetical protein
MKSQMDGEKTGFLPVCLAAQSGKRGMSCSPWVIMRLGMDGQEN